MNEELYLAEIVFITYKGNKQVNDGVTEQVRCRLVKATTAISAFDKVCAIVNRCKTTTGKYRWNDSITADHYTLEIHPIWC